MPTGGNPSRSESAPHESAKATQKPDLSPRQRQILKLLQAGMVNKEVARELDIGLGTVKQHIVALFKKLNVSNRAMAVAHGIEILHEEETQLAHRGQTLTASGLLESRPCVVLSIGLPEGTSQTAVRLMYGILADVASINDAVFVARKGNAGDVIFGVQRVTEYDVAVALQTACGIYADLLAWDALTAAQLRGCLTAGLAFASMKRFGGWTGEAIASAAISLARETLSATLPGNVAFDATTRDLIDVFGIGAPQGVAPVMSFEQLKALQWTGSRPSYPLVGRDTELARLDAALKHAVRGQGTLIKLEGEMGMGKSRLCEEFLVRCKVQKGTTAFFRCSPPVLGGVFYDVLRGTRCTVTPILALLRRTPAKASPTLIIVDDFHLLDSEQQGALTAAGIEAVRQGTLVVFSGRRLSSGDASADTLRLRRLSNKDVETLVRNALTKGAAGRPKKVLDISSVAAGVPLFAVELARQFDIQGDQQRVAFPILVAINARLDNLLLDRSLLRAVANAAGSADIEALAANLGEDPANLRVQAERAAQAGVLAWGTGEALSKSLTFTHPLLQKAIAGLVAE